MMEDRFGEFTREVQEVLEFITSGNLLAGGHLPEDIDAAVIDDLKMVPSDEDYEEYGDDRLIWRDIVAHASRKIYSVEFGKWPRDFPHGKFLSDLVLGLVNRYGRTFPREYKRNYLDKDIPGILAGVVHSRIVMSKANEFYELLFRVFKSGGYPCGWEGKYGDGKLIVYYPPERLARRGIRKRGGKFAVPEIA
jgi:hypothetical protein